MIPSIYRSAAGEEALLRWYETQVASLPLAVARLSRFRGPCFVSFGANDVFFNAEQAVERARAVLPCLVMGEVVAGEGHVPTLEAEQRLYERVGTFLDTHAA